MKKQFTLLVLILSLSLSVQSQISWNMGMNIASSASGNHHPRIVTDAAGNPLVLWGNAARAMFSRWNGTAFTAPVMINPMTLNIAEGNWMGPEIASKGDTVYVVFKKIPEADTASHIYLVRSFDGGINFSLPFRVDGLTDTITRFPTVTTDALGNPVVAYMTFNMGFGNAQWAAAKSADFGSTFSPSVLASGWSSASSTVCDCCPGSIASSGSTMAMLYRDNNSNIRDMWAGVSTDAGNSFPQGIAVDQGNWMLMACPGSGPDGIIAGDTLYTVYMSGAATTYLAWLSKTSMLTMTPSTGLTLTGPFTGLSQQNFPRIAYSGSAAAIVWTQTVNGINQLPILFTNNITSGFPAVPDTVDVSNITNTDAALANGNIFVVWEDDNSGTVKYRKGTFGTVGFASPLKPGNLFSVYPNPSSGWITVDVQKISAGKLNLKIFNSLGQMIFSDSEIISGSRRIEVSERGIYLLRIEIRLD